MKFNINKYSVHGLVNIEVKSQNPRHVKCLNNKYRFFSVDELSSVDIEVVIAPVKFPKETSMIKKGIYHIGDGTMFWKNNRKLVSWEVGLKGLENERVKVLFWGNSISLKYLCMHILEPLINIKLAAKDCVLMHASGVRIAGNVYVFSSLPGTGKTSLAMYLVEKEKANFLSDEFVILSRDAEIT